MKTKLLRKIRSRYGIFFNIDTVTEKQRQALESGEMEYNDFSCFKVFDLKTRKELSFLDFRSKSIDKMKTLGFEKYADLQYKWKQLKKYLFPKRFIGSQYIKMYYVEPTDEIQTPVKR